MYIPPGGFLGAAQNTQAAQALLSGRGSARRSSTRRKRRSSTAKTRRSTSSRKRSTSRRSRPARLVKGSAAAKRYMAKIRRKRRR